jgi:CBS domain-containing protein
MNVASILKQKGRAVSTVPPTITLQEVAKRLTQRRIGALVVVGARGYFVLIFLYGYIL